MNRVHIIGGKNHGKTTLMVDLVSEFHTRGMRVGTIKHTHHSHELDIPGKDSHRHREAGAVVSGILSQSMNAVFWYDEGLKNSEESHLDPDGRYCSFSWAFADCDILLVEGDTQTDAFKLEVWRAVNDTPPIAGRVNNVLAIVTDDRIETPLPILARANVAAVADFILDSCRHQ
jgi:molybdopterin-guanine dinucleotide biosynthesis adapter protein